MTAFKQPQSAPAHVADRRYLNDRRRRQLAINFIDRRSKDRRETAMQAYLWNLQRAG
ncbi:MAG: hypothetical protein GKR90_05035 [Pseudomonadales bacterium]|nr:hypothetical protein [Pseudomonadales bacterium]